MRNLTLSAGNLKKRKKKEQAHVFLVVTFSFTSTEIISLS